jgi:anthranilate synthase/aminodeoxychorismate synthase-like glutamine amidotransferase
LILLIDNYDSFVFNLARYFERLGQRTTVVRNDHFDAAAVERLAPQAIVLSPGPCAPAQAGHSLEIVERLHDRYPMLGVCLGHQTIAEALGGRIARAAEPMHGRTSLVYHEQSGLFAGLPSPLTACRYHSLVVERSSLPAALRISAETSEGVIMGLEHRNYPVFGLQFHPESILTEHGYAMLASFLARAGLAVDEKLPALGDEMPRRATPDPLTPAAPITF